MTMAALRRSRLLHHGPDWNLRSNRRAGGAFMTDLITLALGTGGILLMIAYAVACDRI